MVKGMLSARITLVGKDPNWGVPDESSKIEPTAAIAAIDDTPSNKPLLGVTVYLSPTHQG
jgi:hypothetical protein